MPSKVYSSNPSPTLIRFRFSSLLIVVTLLATLASCGKRPIDDEFTQWVGDDDAASSSADADGLSTADLRIFELSGPVRRLSTVTYYDVTPGQNGQFLIPDSLNCTETIVFFDSLGRYVPRRDERIRRDEQGRIVRWEDHRPNLRRIHGGFLRDTLSYRHVSENVVATSGMGEYAITVYDNAHRIVGQYTDPLNDGEQTAVFNVYLDADGLGNWTRRLGIWTTQSAGRRPHISYTLDERNIVYWQ